MSVSLIRTHEIVGDPHHHPVTATSFQFGANHDYTITLPAPLDPVEIHFQQGPVGRFGANGIDDLDLLAILDNRMQGFVQLSNPDPYTLVAAKLIRKALIVLRKRKVNRMANRTEGT